MSELRDLDATIHREVMGKPVRTCNHGHHWTDDIGLMGALAVPKYSSDMAAAWQVVEWLRNRFSNIKVYADNGWCFYVWNIAADGFEEDIFSSGHQPTAPLAICKAALKAVKEAKE